MSFMSKMVENCYLFDLLKNKSNK